MRRLLTSPEVAELLGVTERQVRRFRESGRLRFVRVGGRVRFEVSELDRFVAAGRSAADVEANETR